RALVHHEVNRRDLMVNLEPTSRHTLEAADELAEGRRANDRRKRHRVIHAVLRPARHDVLGVASLPGGEELANHRIVGGGRIRAHRISPPLARSSLILAEASYCLQRPSIPRGSGSFRSSWRPIRTLARA